MTSFALIGAAGNVGAQALSAAARRLLSAIHDDAGAATVIECGEALIAQLETLTEHLRQAAIARRTTNDRR